MRGTINFSINNADVKAFDAACQIAIRNVGRGTKKATEAACQEIIKDSLAQVPRDTSALASSAYYNVSRRTDTAATTWAYEAVVGYGGANTVVNPKTGKAVSSYMLAVHEDLTARHPIGKAKFLEDPVRDYARVRFPRTVFKYAQESLASVSK